MAGGLLFLPACYTDSGEIDDGVCNLEAAGDVRLPPSDWLRGARVAGLDAFEDATVCDLGPLLDRMADERVSVVEVDPDLSAYLDEAAFAQQAGVIDLVARESHKRGMRCVAYYPVLESLTPEADKKVHTMYKDHPDWVQVGIDGKPNVFVGGGGRVFWVAEGEESAWLCPTSGYADYFIGRVQKLAGTALDGVWGDVPLLSDIVGVWPCLNETCKAQFRAETGLEAPTVADWSETFMRWIAWRHRVIWQLEQRIVAGAKAIRPEFEVIIETVTMDYTSGTVQGLDGAHADDGSIYRVWEIDAVSDATAMRDATEDDWYSMLAMMKYAHGSSSPRPAWVFCYGLQEDDAERVMSLAILTGSSPYETKIPEINKSVGTDYRKRMYAWLETHPQLLLSSPANACGVLFSSLSRDVLDRAGGVGLYTSVNAKDNLWWTSEDEDSAKERPYVGDWRGFCKFLVNNHVAFDLVTTPHADDATLSRYAMLVVPSAASLQDDLVARLQTWVNEGGTLVVTGPDAGAYDHAPAKRASPLLLEAFGLLGSPPKGWTTLPVGKGRVLHTQERAGQLFFNGSAAGLEALEDAFPSQIDTDAPPAVAIEVRRADTGELVVVFANLVGLGGREPGVFAPQNVSFTCTVQVGTAQVSKVTLTAPAPPGGVPFDQAVPYTVEGTAVRFAVDLRAVAAAVIQLA
jgi:Beta-galactosidase trimerisation domain